MDESQDVARTTSQAFYLTLSSITSSLALGYLLTTADELHLTSWPPDLGCWLRVTLVFQMIVLTWHEYAQGTVYFRWQINYFDSIVPFAFAVVQYVAISGLRPKADVWFWGSFAAFAFVSAVAYLNQRAKAAGDSANAQMWSLHRAFHLWAITTCVSVGISLSLLACYVLQSKKQASMIWPIAANIVFALFAFTGGRLRRKAAVALSVPR